MKSAAAAVMAALALSGCVSATPRPYAPLMQPQPTDRGAFEREFQACAASVSSGRRNFGQSVSAVVVGGVGGVAAVQTLSGAAAAVAVGGSEALAATGLGLLVVVPLATYKLSSGRRKRNEREVQQAMTACLAETGHAVSGWTRVDRRDAARAAMLTPTRASTP